MPIFFKSPLLSSDIVVNKLVGLKELFMQEEQVQIYKQSGKNGLMGEMENELPQEGTVQRVRAYVVGFVPDLIVGIEREGSWYLPGGVVEGDGTPPGFAKGEHLGPLAHHIRHQTGLALTRLSKAVSLALYPGERGPEVTVLYPAEAKGDLTRGTRLDPLHLPEFAPVCGEPADAIAQFVRRKAPSIWTRILKRPR